MFFSAVYSGDFPGLKKSLRRKIEPGHTFETSPTVKKVLERDWKKATRNTDGTMIPQGLWVKPEPETFIRPLLREDITGSFTQGMPEREPTASTTPRLGNGTLLLTFSGGKGSSVTATVMHGHCAL